MLFASLLLLLVPATAFALPTSSVLSALNAAHVQSCSLKDFIIPVVPGLSVPAGQKPILATVGRGTQNYTCTAGRFASSGAVANLYDASCVFDVLKPYANSSVVSEQLTKLAFQILNYPDTTGLPVAVHHFFAPNETPGAAAIPEFATDKDHVLLTKTGTVNAPNAANDVTWLQLSAIEGEGNLAKTVFRLNTVGGQPPTSCSVEGETTEIQYAAMYYFTQ